MPKAPTLPDERTDVKERSLDHQEGLYRHQRRAEWGVAILAWERGSRIAYQFEDGVLRKFKKGYYSLMRPVRDVQGSEDALVADLQQAIEDQRGSRPDPVQSVCTFAEQVDLFTQLYPEGFEDPKWVSDHRGNDASRALKRHREPPRRAALQLLSRNRLDRLLAESRHHDAIESVVDVLSGTNLVALKSVKSIQALDEEGRRGLADAVRMLLHEEETRFGRRFKEFVTTLEQLMGSRPSWRLATVLPALFHPQDHVCVRRSAFHRQAGSTVPVGRYTRRPQRVGYKAYRRVARVVRTRLDAAGHPPRDFLDVHDFIWTTLRKAALAHL